MFCVIRRSVKHMLAHIGSNRLAWQYCTSLIGPAFVWTGTLAFRLI